MKIIIIAIATIFFASCKDAYKHERPVLHEAELVAVPEYYRRIIGYDSVCMIFFQGKWDLNFCYPNKLQIHKIGNLGIGASSPEGDWIRGEYDSIPMEPQIDTAVMFPLKIGTIKGDYISGSATKNVYNNSDVPKKKRGKKHAPINHSDEPLNDY